MCGVMSKYLLSTLYKLRAVAGESRETRTRICSHERALELGSREAAGLLGDLRVRSVLLQVGQAAQARGKTAPGSLFAANTHQDVGGSPYKLESFDIRAVFLQLHEVQINCK